MKKPFISVALSAVLGIALASSAHAGVVLAQSTFNSGSEGWLVSDFVYGGGPSAPVYVAVGGNPGGFIRTADLYNFNGYVAPSAFLGNQSAAYGGLLHFEQRVASSGVANAPMVYITDGTTTLQFRTGPAASGANWTDFDIPLLASAGWETFSDGNNPGAAATEAQLQSVLSNLTTLRLRADWLIGGTEQVDLDNVRLESGISTDVPEPASLALVGVALVGLASARRRRQAQ